MSSNKRVLLNIPNSDAGKLQYIIENYSECDAIEMVSHVGFKFLPRSEETCSELGIMLSEPAQRLLQAFNSAKASNPHKYSSFRDFYTEKTRVNFYSRLFSEVNISSISFIGLQEHLYKSALMAADWLSTQLYRLPYNVTSQQTKNAMISSEEFDEIKLLYNKDYEIYNAAKATFDKRWLDYTKHHEISLKFDKKLTIHLGPPKTGTSAIQSWLHSNREALLSEGKLYPEHTADANGVSSGNFEQLVTFDTENKRAYFDDNKAQSLISRFNATHCDTLLLSSEHFFYYLIWLFSRFQKAEYIFYIRHPLGVAESSFHQEVKRHNRTVPFSISSNIGFSNLLIVNSLAKEFECQITYRFYDEKQFINGSLLSDFAHAIRTKVPVPVNAKKVNTQYSPGAIVLMLKCNTFASEKLRRELDMFLQGYSENIGAFSFVSPSEFNDIQCKLKSQVEQLTETDQSLDYKSMVSLIDHYKKPPMCSEAEINKDLSCIIDTMMKFAPTLARSLYQEISQSADETTDDLLRHFNFSWYQKWLFKLVSLARLQRP
ncbi:hypothetical protein D210916BOD24_27440 [Alteromonas sp. D210916BOD_24]|uniref:hypothetical protein n=1 Tax=Alteromonas sp. D210916BOD_24 TaxID=3157618 RepID=UPI00399CCDA8